MERLAYFDCFSGASGDMMLGALIDAGCNLEEMEQELRRIAVSDWYITSDKIDRHGLRAAHVHVEFAETYHHRSLTTILELIEDAKLSSRVTKRAAAIFRRLAESEALVHGVPIDEVHFHEVGAVDAIVDIVGSCIGFEQLGIDEFSCSPLNVGAGRVSTAHGLLPVPAPATAELLRGIPTYSTGIQRELVTPTGAAIITTMASHFGAQPPMITRMIGYGAGSADLPEQPNVMRLLVGDSATTAIAGTPGETVSVLEANLDDMSPQIYGYFSQCAFDAGAYDVFSTPVQMKKNRPGQLITVICAPKDTERLTELFFRETTTLGVRKSNRAVQTLDREIVDVETSMGRVRVKVGRLNGRTMNASPEYEDCRRIAATFGVPLKDVLAEAMSRFQKNGGVANVNAD